MILPDFPWDKLNPYREIISDKGLSLINLSVGSPVDPVDSLIQDALLLDSEKSAYPTAKGKITLDQTLVTALRRRFKAGANLAVDNVLPTIGSKEAIALLPLMLDLVRPKVVIPHLSYPTYTVAATLVGGQVIPQDFTKNLPDQFDLVFINSPNNPTGEVLELETLQTILGQVRKQGAILVSDECYLSLDWTGKGISMLNPQVNGGSLANIIVTNSLSKVSNLASYRAAFLAGDNELISKITNFRRHTGLLVPTVIQTAMQVALEDDSSVNKQKAVYRERRKLLIAALSKAGFSFRNSEAGLYIWVTSSNGESDWDLVKIFAEQGILVAPGSFYGSAGKNSVRISITATDDDIKTASERISKVNS